MRFSQFFAVVFLVLCLPFVSFAADMNVGEYELLSSVRVTRTVYDYTYRASITSSLARDAVNVSATLTNKPSNVSIIDGELSFGNVGVGASVKSSDTFKVRVDRATSFDMTKIQWQPTYALANQLPVLEPIPAITVNEGETVTITPIASEPDGDQITISYSDWMNTNTRLTNYADAGTYNVKVTATDSLGASTSQNVTVIVENVNNPPVLKPIAPINIQVGESFTILPEATDPDGDTLAITYSGWLNISGKTTAEADIGYHVVAVTVDDGFGGVVKQDVQITVSKIVKVANLPVSLFADTHYEAPADSPLAGLILDIPSGAVTAGTNLEIGYVVSPPMHQDLGDSFGTVFYLLPRGTTFSKPITVSISYNSSDLGESPIISEEVLRLFTFIEGDPDWIEILGSSSNTENAIVSGKTGHLSYYAINGDKLYTERMCQKDHNKSCTELNMFQKGIQKSDSDTVAMHTSKYYPVILVHGIYGGLGTFDNTAKFLGSIGGSSLDLMDPSNIDVWIMDYSTTKPLNMSAFSLSKAIEKVKLKTGADKVNLITHSMGGLVARAYLQDVAFQINMGSISEYNKDVKKLMTLGTPHKGANISYKPCISTLLFNLGLCGLDPLTCLIDMYDTRDDDVAACQMLPGDDQVSNNPVLDFIDNINYPNDANSIASSLPKDVVYSSVYGNIIKPGIFPFLSLEFDNSDCTVSTESAKWGLGLDYIFSSEELMRYSHTPSWVLPGCNSPSLAAVGNTEHKGWLEIKNFVTGADAIKPVPSYDLEFNNVGFADGLWGFVGWRQNDTVFPGSLENNINSGSLKNLFNEDVSIKITGYLEQNENVISTITSMSQQYGCYEDPEYGEYCYYNELTDSNILSANSSFDLSRTYISYDGLSNKAIVSFLEDDLYGNGSMENVKLILKVWSNGLVIKEYSIWFPRLFIGLIVPV